MQECQYISNDILAEMEKMIILSARREMVSDTNSNQCFALIAKETTDIRDTDNTYTNDAIETPTMHHTGAMM